MLTYNDYRIGWICALPLELAAAEAMLDTVHDPLSARVEDDNTYVLGNIGQHNIVVACLPAGVYGTTSATSVAMHMRTTFPSLRFCLMVGVAGGAPSPKADIRLGDIVVSKPTAGYGGVIQYDYGKALAGEFRPTGFLDKPPAVLLTAIARLQARHHLYGSHIQETIAEVLKRYRQLSMTFSSPGQDKDLLFISSFNHIDRSQSRCDGCDRSMLEPRSLRHLTAPFIFYGLIASANQVMQDAVKRDSLSHRHGILCFEMEAAGLMDVLPCLIIRGICDYSDSHKNKEWQGYAAINAAAYARELLSVIPVHEVTLTPAVDPSASYVYSSNHHDFPEQGQPLRITRATLSLSANSANNLPSDYSTRFDRPPPGAAEPPRFTPSRLAGKSSSAYYNSQDEYSGESDISSSDATEPPRSLLRRNIKPKLIIGIDVGTRYTRVSYATTKDIASGNIHSITSWPNSAGPVDEVPTLVSYYNWQYSWGYNIPKSQIPLPWLWAILLKNEDINQFMVVRTDDIPEIERVRGPLPWVEDLKASHALSHYLRALWNHTTETIRNHLGAKAVDSIRFHVVLTLPTVWDRTGSQELRRAARLSGIQDRRTAGPTSLNIARRSTAAAQAAIYELVPSLQAGDPYVICYAGGRTVEVTTYRVSKPSGVDMYRSVSRKCKLLHFLYIQHKRNLIMAR
ncbi:nucleoside phosphorylase domain-containing protein [Aspergillus varians]